MNEELNENVQDQVQDQVQETQDETPSYVVNDDGDYVLNSGERTEESVETDVPTDEVPSTEGVALGEVQEESQVEEQKEEELVELGQVSQEPEEAEEAPSIEDVDLPEGWNKMIEFLKENPGATPEDYVNIKKGADLYSDEELLKQKIAKDNGLDPKEDTEEVDFLYEDKFSYDEDLDEERDVKLKKVEIKKALKEARSDLAKQQEEYLGNLTFKDQSPEVKEAMEFFKSSKESESKSSAIREKFLTQTDNLFSEQFKGFEFKYGGDKAQRIKVGKVAEVKNAQSDINNFFNKHVGEDGTIKNPESYHKALWAADNVDAIVSHFYEQGRADAVRESAKAAKNIDMGARKDVASVSDDSNKPKFKLVGGNDEDFKFKFRK